GQFVHLIRRNLNITYIVMNNGCYGLTKGQDSATADQGSKSKAGAANLFQNIDLPGLAMELGAGFVARSFSGDKIQLIPLIKAALAHPGFALIDVISPCVTFNNNVGSTKSYDYVRHHIDATATFDFVPIATEIKTEYEQGTTQEVKMHDGSYLRFNKLQNDWDPCNKESAVQALHRANLNGEILTGLIYINEDSEDLHSLLNTNKAPLNSLQETDLCPGLSTLQQINASLK
ncbi:MAG: thiamine pyrophosphate-dependent enzyme, partial [Saprospiraceae bacterium]